MHYAHCVSAGKVIKVGPNELMVWINLHLLIPAKSEGQHNHNINCHLKVYIYIYIAYWMLFSVYL